jgi:hypothetical protein
MAVVRMALSAFKKHPTRQSKAKSTFALDAFALRRPIRQSVKSTSALKRGGTAKIFIRVILKLQQLVVSRKKIVTLTVKSTDNFYIKRFAQ